MGALFVVGWMVGYRVVTSFIVGTIIGLLGCWPFSHCTADFLGISFLTAVAAQQPNLSNRGL